LLKATAFIALIVSVGYTISVFKKKYKFLIRMLIVGLYF